jgi:hypothetical protein
MSQSLLPCSTMTIIIESISSAPARQRED